MLQAAGSWSVDACCAVPGNECRRSYNPYYDSCVDRTSSSDWLFGLWPGPPQRFETTGTRTDPAYQYVHANIWPHWGSDLEIGLSASGAPGGSRGLCHQGRTYRGTDGEICGGDGNWGATDVEVWYPI